MIPTRIHVRQSQVDLLSRQGNVYTTIYAKPLPCNTSAAYTDLAQVWQHTSQRPDGGNPANLIIVVSYNRSVGICPVGRIFCGATGAAAGRKWNIFVHNNSIVRWAYVAELMPTTDGKEAQL